MSDPVTTRSVFDPRHPPTQVTAWMTVGEARAALAAAGQPALPVVGHGGLIGLVTIEALGGPDAEHCPAADIPVVSVLDWHLVQVPPDADELEVVDTFTDAAWRWLVLRGQEQQAPEGSPR